jgi:telomere length regulation protein
MPRFISVKKPQLTAIESLIHTLAEKFLLSECSRPETFSQLCLRQSSVSRKVLPGLIKFLSGRFLNRLELKTTAPDATVSAVAGLLKSLVSTDRSRQDVLVSWCCSTSGAGLGDGVGIRRAVLAALGHDRDLITTVFERSLAQFGDELYIKHTPILQQDGKPRDFDPNSAITDISQYMPRCSC